MTDHRPHTSRHPEGTLRMARLLGWFSIGLGLAEILAPRQLGRPVGMGGRTSLLRLYGLREIAQGLGILLSRDPKLWVWARVVGDALDAGTLVSGSRSRPGKVLGGLAVLGAVGLLDLYCARRLTPMPVSEPKRLADYRGRSGFPRSPEEMRGAALRARQGPEASPADQPSETRR